ncbi:aminotransferase class V-fold PLP-dependent enzyme, partial [Phenylobacterium sp.]|uniref:aminotransferase class V-fold PLP-dependent enzyme n=1 Tax=Phenylobacterium sp. TaxID=1871053 RepID=UPI002810C3B4
MSQPVYLDHNATAPVRPEAIEAVVKALGVTGNASSIHAYGRAARAILEAAREEVAGLIGAAPANVVFT